MSFSRLSAVSSVYGGKVIEYTPPVKKYGPYQVDRSHFHPMSEAVKQLTSYQVFGNDAIKPYFDFLDGKDTGLRVPVDRMHGVSDITEISTAVREQSASLRKQLSEQSSKAQKQRERTERQNRILESIQSSETQNRTDS